MKKVLFAIVVSTVVVSPSFGQVMLKCGEVCHTDCNFFGLCGEPYCAGDQDVAGYCDCEIKERCVWNGCYNICRPFGGLCELGCDDGGIPSVIVVPPIHQVAAEQLDRFPGAALMLGMVDGLGEGRHRLTFARRLDGVELEPGVPAYGRPSTVAISVHLGKGDEASRFEVESEEGVLLAIGRVTHDGHAEVDLFHAVTGQDKPETVRW